MKKKKIEKLLEILSPQKSLEDFKHGIKKLKSDLKQGVSSDLKQTVRNEVNKQINSLEFDFSPLLEKIGEVEELAEKVKEDIENKLKDFNEELKNKPDEEKLNRLEKEVREYKDGLVRTQKSIEETIKVVKSQIIELNRKQSEQPDDLDKKVKELQERINNWEPRGGAAHIRMTNGGTVFSSRYADVNFIAGTGVTITTADDNTNKRADITFNSSGISIGDLVINGTVGSVLFIGAGGVLAQDNANFFYDDTNNRLGIGTNSPAEGLHVHGSDILFSRNAQQNLYFRTNNAVIAAGSAFSLQRGRGTYASPTAITSSDVMGDVLFQGYDGSFYSTGTRIRSEASENFSTTARGSRMIFSTVLNTTTILRDRIQILNTGETDWLDTSGNNLVVIDQNGGMVINEQGSSSGDLRAESDTFSNFFFLDASADTLGVGAIAPTTFSYQGASNLKGPLQIHNTSVDALSLWLDSAQESSGSGQPPIIATTFSNGTYASRTTVSDGNQVFRILALAYNGSNYNELGGFNFVVDGTPGVGDMPGRIEFTTTRDGESTVTVQALMDNQGRWAFLRGTAQGGLHLGTMPAEAPPLIIDLNNLITTPIDGSIEKDSSFFYGTIGSTRYVIVGMMTASLTQGAIPFGGTAGLMAQDATNLFYDNTNDFLGVGTNTPSERLHVFGGDVLFQENAQHITTLESAVALASSNPTLRFRRSNGTIASPTAIASGGQIGELQFQGYDGAAYGTGANIIAQATEAWSGSAHGTKLRFIATANAGTTTTEYLTIDQSGFVGIGQTAPTQLLHLFGGILLTERNAAAITEFSGASATANQGSTLRFSRSRGTIASPTAISADDLIANIECQGYDGSVKADQAGITVDATQNWTGSARGTRMEFFTTANSTTTKTQRMVIDENGEVGIGTASPGSLLDVAGSFQCDSITNDTGLAHGTYTPTLTNTTNVAASTPRLSTYMRVGNTVTVAGQLDIDPTAGGNTVLEISLPVASNFSTAFQLGGTASSMTITNESAGIEASAANDTALMRYQAVDTTNHTMAFIFTYQVI